MLKGVLVDWGGVLTTSLVESIAAWCAADRIDADHYRGVMRDLFLHAYEGGESPEPDGGNPIHALERGEIPAAVFERDLAARLVTLDGVPPEAEGLLTRMFAAFRPVEEMHAMLRAARAAGLVTCLVSNSWGNEYPAWDGLFDEVVISGEVGMRKPEPRIFQHALDLVGMPAEQCVFIDDIEANILAARSLGIVGIHHVEPVGTLTEMERLFNMPFRA